MQHGKPWIGALLYYCLTHIANTNIKNIGVLSKNMLYLNLILFESADDDETQESYT